MAVHRVGISPLNHQVNQCRQRHHRGIRLLIQADLVQGNRGHLQNHRLIQLRRDRPQENLREVLCVRGDLMAGLLRIRDNLPRLAMVPLPDIPYQATISARATGTECGAIRSQLRLH
jgi:hypothetical protein